MLLMRKFLCLILSIVMLMSLASCGEEKADDATDSADEAAASDSGSDTGSSDGSIMVQIEMENGGIIKMELYPDIAPITVANFVKLVNEGFYDGLTFHRVIAGFMIQGGDPNGDGTGGSSETIKGEFAQNGVENNLSHTRGVVSMARRSYPLDSASSQFFICNADSTYLDGSYAAFGKVVEGMDVVDEISAVATDSNDKPTTPQVMKKVTVIDN
jgi:peptidyl-prolyl cis-trans isomerase B (cyclophilin B)